ncbi:MAG: transporter [Fidelibacterota bacterium]
MKSTSWENPNHERTNNSAYMFYLNYSLSNNFSVEALVPWQIVTNEKILFPGQYSHQPQGGKYVRHAQGMGDVVIMGRYQFNIKMAQLSVGLGVKLATGDSEAMDDFGVRISDNLQIGSGTVDPVFLIFSAYPGNKWLFLGNLFSRIPLRENIYGYQYGAESHVNLGVNYDLSDLIFLRGNLNGIFTSRDKYQYGEPEFSRGGRWLYFIPGLGIRLTRMLTMDLQYPFPVYQYVNESQLIPTDLMTVNLSYTLKVK